MINLIIASIKGRIAKNSIIILSLVIAVCSLYIGLNFGKSLETDIAINSARLGADLAVVPLGTKENGEVEAAQGPPSKGLIPVSNFNGIQKIAGIEKITQQVYLNSFQLGGKNLAVIGFDPVTDFTVQPWLLNTLESSLSSHDVLVGVDVVNGEGTKIRSGDNFEINGQVFRVAGTLDKSGSYMDNAVFRPINSEELHKNASWYLIKVLHNISLDQYANVLQTNFPQIEVMTRNELNNTLDTQLSGILRGNGLLVATVFIIITMMLIIAAMFNLTVHEQMKDFGILQAMGAKKNHISQLIAGEALVLVVAGIIGGLVIGEILFQSFSRILTRPGLTVADTPIIFKLEVSLSGAILALLIGVIAALYPAFHMSKLDPYDAIRQGE